MSVTITESEIADEFETACPDRSTCQHADLRYDWFAKSGRAPRWRRDGKELFFIEGAAIGDPYWRVYSVAVRPSAHSFEFDPPKELFDSPSANAGPHPGGGGYHVYAVSPDGQRFLIPRPASDNTVYPIAVATNWTASLKK